MDFKWIDAIDIIYLKGELSFQKFGIIAMMISQAGQWKKQNKAKGLKNQESF